MKGNCMSYDTNEIGIIATIAACSIGMSIAVFDAANYNCCAPQDSASTKNNIIPQPSISPYLQNQKARKFSL
jgi:hypothetical protein